MKRARMASVAVVTLLLSSLGCDGVVLDRLRDVGVLCTDDDPDAGCIGDGRLGDCGLVLILPGISGTISLLEREIDLSQSEVAPVVQRSGETLAQAIITLIADGELSDEACYSWSARVWDWTDTPEIRELADDPDAWQFDRERLRQSLYENRATRAVAQRLARRIREWELRPLNAGKPLNLICGSGGALIALLACEAEDGFGNPILENRHYFDRVLLCSPAFSTDRSIEALSQRTRDGVYLYYSKNDATLHGSVCQAFFLPFVGLVGTVQYEDVEFAFPWKALGRYGYAPGNPNLSHIAGQLGWIPEYSARRYNNSGAHLMCYRDAFFATYLLRVAVSLPVYAPWRIDLDDTYLPPQLEFSAEHTESGDLALNGGAEGAHVLLVGGHSRRDTGLESAAQTIERVTGASVQVWEWSEAPGCHTLTDVERLSPSCISAAASQLAVAIRDWSTNNTADLYILAASGGALVVAGACELQDDTGHIVPDGATRRIVFSSGLQPADRSLRDVIRKTTHGVFNYYSRKNDFLLGEFDCADADDASLGEYLAEFVYPIVHDSIPWAPAGRFGYRMEPGLLQLGDDRDEADFSSRLDELTEPDFAIRMAPLFDIQMDVPAGWTETVRADYSDVASDVRESSNQWPTFEEAPRAALVDIIAWLLGAR